MQPRPVRSHRADVLLGLGFERGGQPDLFGVQPGLHPAQHDVVDEFGVPQPHEGRSLVGEQGGVQQPVLLSR